MPASFSKRITASMSRVLAAAVACALACMTLASSFAIEELHDHECAGEGCTTCIVLCAARTALSSAAIQAAAQPGRPAPLRTGTGLLPAWALILTAETPVSQGVRLLI